MCTHSTVDHKGKNRGGDGIAARLADGDDLDGEGVLVVVRGAVNVVAHQLLVTAVPNGDHAAQEINELHRVLPVAKKEVHTLWSMAHGVNSQPPIISHNLGTRCVRG